MAWAVGYLKMKGKVPFETAATLVAERAHIIKQVKEGKNYMTFKQLFKLAKEVYDWYKDCYRLGADFKYRELFKDEHCDPLTLIRILGVKELINQYKNHYKKNVVDV